MNVIDMLALNKSHAYCIQLCLFLLTACVSNPANWQNTFMNITKEKHTAIHKELGYDPAIELLPGTDNTKSPIICLHGYGANKNIAQNLRQYNVVPNPLITFNFPNHDLHNIETPSFGTIDELKPIFIILKACIDAGLKKINLYGFSAGGGATINCLAILNSDRYAQELIHLGIDSSMKNEILAALQAGSIILDCPLKSIDEIIAFRGNSKEMSLLAEQYKINNMIPINSATKLKGLKLNIFLYFEQPDDILSNKDDELFLQRLRTANAEGKTYYITGKHGGHNTHHAALWKTYKKFS